MKKNTNNDSKNKKDIQNYSCTGWLSESLKITGPPIAGETEERKV